MRRYPAAGSTIVRAELRVRTLRSHVLTRRWPRKARKSAADLKALAADIQDTERASNSFVPTELPENQQPCSADQYAESAPSCWAPLPQTFTSWFCRAKKTQCTYKLGVSCSSIGAHGVGQALPAAEAQQPRQQTSRKMFNNSCARCCASKMSDSSFHYIAM